MSLHESIARHRVEIVLLCQRLNVSRLDVFGSAVTDAFRTDSDVDFLVEFIATEDLDLFDAYFSLKEELEALLCRRVDLVTATSVHNPYLRERIEATRETIYIA